MTLDEISSAADEARALLDHIRKSRDEQPARLATARSEADEARGWSILEEPWETMISAVPTYNAAGERTGDALVLPSITAKELFGARLAFDMLDAGLDTENDPERIETVKNRYFAELKGEPGLLFLVCMAALDTIASLVVPQMVDELETRASNYDVRVMLAEARAKAWRGRVSEINKVDAESDGQIKPIDGFDIASNAMDGNDILGGDEEQRRQGGESW
jgi:hypothetical protein